MTSAEHGRQPPTIGRHRIVRAGAALAWSLPAISLARAVPAFAVSGAATSPVSGSGHWRADGLDYLDLPLEVTNGCATPDTGLSVVLSVCGVETRPTPAPSTFRPVGPSSARATRS